VIVVPPPVKVKKHLGILDLLRGFAALSVVLYHFCLPGKHGGILTKFYSPLLDSTFWWGHLGVEIFFVISGFIIPFSLWNASYRLANFWPYMRKRLLRILPPAYIVILLTLLQYTLVDYLLHHKMDRLGTITFGQLASNLFFVVPFTGSQWFNGVFWTLSIEFQFYILLGLFYNLLFKQGHFVWFVAINLLLFACSYMPGMPSGSYWKYSPLFAAGGSTLLFFKGRLTLLPYIGTLLLWAVLSYIALGSLATAFGIVTSLLIAFCRINQPIFTFLGNISYSLYLTHFLIGSSAEFLLARLLPAPSHVTSVVVIIVITWISIGGAYCYYRFVEQPLLNLAQRLTHK